jgi:uncharacterized membrane protein YcaP (DUF421 family)
MDYVNLIIGQNGQLPAAQMCVRSAIMFFVLLVLMRVGGSRIYSKKSAFDTIIMITLGAIVARGIVGSSPFFSTMWVAITLIAIHRLLGWLSIKSRSFEKLVKGNHRPLFSDGRLIEKNLMKSSLSEEDIFESLRLETKENSFENVKEAFSESNGRISFIMKKRT